MNVIQFPKQPPPPGGFELPRALVAELAQGVATAVLSSCNRLVAAGTAADFAAAIAELHLTLADNAAGLQISSHKRARGRRRRNKPSRASLGDTVKRRSTEGESRC